MAASEAPAKNSLPSRAARLHPDPALAAGHAMRVVGPRLGKRRQLAAEFDDVLVAVHPVVEHRQAPRRSRRSASAAEGSSGGDERVGRGHARHVRRPARRVNPAGGQD